MSTPIWEPISISQSDTIHVLSIFQNDFFSLYYDAQWNLGEVLLRHQADHINKWHCQSISLTIPTMCNEQTIERMETYCLNLRETNVLDLYMIFLLAYLHI